jgi:endo-1,4-beta-xylanase
MKPCSNFAVRQHAPAVMALVAALLLACLLSSASAQNLLQNPGFESGTTGWSGYGSVTLTASTAQAHSGSRSAYVRNRTAAWNGVAQSVLGVLQPGQTYRMSAWVRLAQAGSEPVKLTLQRTDASGSTWNTVANGTATSTGWTQLSGGYTHSITSAPNSLLLYLEGPAAGVEFYADDFVVEPYDWRTQANARIEQVRRRDVRLQIVDTEGRPTPGVGITVRQTRHQFAFGSAINQRISNPTYAAFFRTNFQWAVMENESKWYANEPTRSNVTYTAANAITNYCFTNGITLRGHTLFWAVPENVQSWVTNLSDAHLRIHLTNRLNSAVNHFKGTFVHWDVNNELLHGDYFGDRLGDWVNPWMFQHAHALDPQARLFANDYNVVAGSETEAYKAQIRALIAANAPIHGIGAQGHFGAAVNPLLTELRLTSLAELGLPLWITEYDSLHEDEYLRADNLEALYRVAFSLPAVEGVLMWGFWAGSHWRGSNAAIVNLDWTLNEAGRRYQSLLAEWTTTTNGVTDAEGGFQFRGFHGSYDLLLTPAGGQPTLRRMTLELGTGTKIVALVAHVTGARPVLHGMEPGQGNASFRFWLTGDAGRAYLIQRSPQLSPSQWTTVTLLSNATGTVGFTNSASPAPGRQFFRARRL